MHENKDILGCVKVTASKITESIDFVCTKIGEEIIVTAKSLSSTIIEAGRIGEDVNVTAQSMVQRPRFSCSVICSLGVETEYYFMVQEGAFILIDGRKFGLVDV